MNIAPVIRQETELLQSGRNPYVEQSIRTAVQIERRFEHLIGPGMHLCWCFKSLPVEAAHVAALLMKAHQAMHGFNRRERRLDGRLHRQGPRTVGANFDKSPEQRP